MPRVRLNWVGLTLQGRYQVERRLGEGGMGTVYVAQDLHTQRPVVVKAPRLALLENPTFFRRFQREMGVLLRVRHPHVVSVLDVGEHQRIPFVVMPYLSGGSLRERLRASGGRLRGGEAWWPWLGQVALGLDYLHGLGWVHRDVKPENILFDESGNGYVADLGAVKVQEGEQTKLTQTGQVLGTPGYMAPELWLGQGYDGRADVYALAVVVYEGLVGRLPYEASSLVGWLEVMRGAGGVRWEGVGEEVPLGVRQAVERGLSREASRRYESCVALVEALRAGWAVAWGVGVDVAAAGGSLSKGAVPEWVRGAVAESSGRAGGGAGVSREVVGGGGGMSETPPPPPLTTELSPAGAGSGGSVLRWLVLGLVGGLLGVLFVLVLVVLLLWSRGEGGRAAVRGVGDREAEAQAHVWQVGVGGALLPEVVARAAAGDIIELPAGRWELPQGLVVDKALTLRGAGREQTQVVSEAEGYVLCFRGTGPWRLEGLTVEHVGGRWANVVVVEGGQIEIRNCVCRGGVWDEPNQRGGCGICLCGTARGVVSGCICGSNGLHGIEVSGRAEPQLEGNTCENNQQGGIAYFDSAGGVAWQNVCRQNGLAGIGVNAQAQPQLEGNTCGNNQQDGIAYLGSAGGVARQNVCRQNGLHGIEVSSQAEPHLEGNTCENNKDCGIAYLNSAGGVARQNVCSGNRRYGIYVAPTARPVIDHSNRCFDNGLRDLYLSR
jgi:parallel beta-helix repeat protein